MRALAALFLAAALPAAAEVPEPSGFHAEPYRAPVPATVEGRPGLTAAEAARLHAQGVPFVDVLPRQKRPEGLPQGTIWHVPAHRTIPGAVWLPDTGYDRLAPTEERYLRDGLARVTGGQPAAPLVIFCKRDCWMSWNAAKRALGWGFAGVQWFPGGVEDWQAEGGTLQEAVPAPGP